uniref:30S ribosomal protein S16 n=1 Tax=Nephromyces sp. ex Molgula occidentalis TaxID=2544991 RepID=A0A5C1H8X7_9APIC|nr:hypothetical protein [Nephromyces sp. ex Molgula occidentalis]
MIALYKKTHKSKSKTIKLNKNSNLINLGIYHSKQNIFYYDSKKISKYLKLGNKISKNLIHLFLKDLKI